MPVINNEQDKVTSTKFNLNKFVYNKFNQHV